jgi:hypothetical protein
MKKKLLLSIIFIPVLLVLVFVGYLGCYMAFEKTITSDDPNDFKYPVTDLLYSNYVEAASFINSGEFEPKYCDGRIDKLIRIKPKPIKPNEIKRLSKLINKWLYANNYTPFENLIADNFKYEYSQLLDRKPIDCYSLTINNELKVYFRIDNERSVYGEISENGWIINFCD